MAIFRFCPPKMYSVRHSGQGFFDSLKGKGIKGCQREAYIDKRLTEDVNYLTEQLLPGLYRLEIPLPASPLKAINSYVIKGNERCLIIDTGLDRPECLEALRTGLAELFVDLNRTDFFLTHMHADHTGLVHAIKSPDSVVYASGPDAAAIHSFAEGPSRWQPMLDYACLNGFPPDEAQTSLRRHPGFLFGPKGRIDFTVVDDGTSINYGNYHFRCIATPGHTKGHICLYEPAAKILISGDHILGDITPNISLWADNENPLGVFIESLKKTAALDVDLVLPGHRRIFQDCRGRIDQLITHHRHRADEVLSILSSGGKTAYAVASRMSWQLTCRTWEEFPPAQKWFATGEALAHLRLLESENAVRRETHAGQTVYLI